jgi:hypothetical protein
VSSRKNRNTSDVNLSFSESIRQIEDNMQKLEIIKNLQIEKAYKSGNVENILQANNYIKSANINNQQKSILVDPQLSANNGYVEKRYSVSYDMLRKMAKTEIINAIIKTRKNQVAEFSMPQENKYSPGFVITKRKKGFFSGEDAKLTKQEQKYCDSIAQFIMNCGVEDRIYHGQTFDGFLRLIVDDSLTFDQANFEIVNDKKGSPVEFFNVDASTIRIADFSSLNKNEIEAKMVNNYLPFYVQMYQSRPIAEFYPWEMCFGLRNPTTNIQKNGYGDSELEDLIKTITNLLNADQYNGNYFKVGSNPRGIISYSGITNQNALSDFRQSWNAQVSGVNNMHKTPVINADKISWIPTHESNRDMEYSTYQEFLIKICSAIYTIDPSEFGFQFNGGANENPAFTGSQEYKLKYSRDKGLKPLLKQIQFWINKYIVYRINPDYEFQFVGIDSQDENNELTQDIQKLNSFQTFNEIRAKRNLPKLEFGDIPANPIYFQLFSQAQQQQMQGSQESNAFMQSLQDELEKANNNTIVEKGNPFQKDLNTFINTINEK